MLGIDVTLRNARGSPRVCAGLATNAAA
jgi:hypothetical protein